MGTTGSTTTGAHRRAVPLLAALGTAAATALLPMAAPAVADTAPPAGVAPTVSADALPTVQINGVVWDQVILGNRVFATGDFTRARPAGSPAGSNETVRNHILAFDLTTGALISSWAPSLNAQGRALAVSADGSRLYVGGDFTQVNGTTRNRLAALDPGTGALITSFAPSANSRVNTLAVRGDTVYAGGWLTTMNGQSRQRVAAVNGAGATLAWNPNANAEVIAVTAPPNTTKVVIGGRFTQLGGAANYGLGAVDGATGANVGFPANQVVRNAGNNAAIWSLASDASQVYGTGYAFGSGGNLESTFAANSATGALVQVDGCRGDTYDVFPIGPVLYNVSHHHDCGSIGGLPQTNPWTYQRAAAFTTTPARTNSGGSFNGRPAPGILHWHPTISAGTFTGQSQGAWTVTGNDQYVVLGGEFPRVNNVAQQGLVRFGVSSIAPDLDGPQAGSELVANTSVTGGTVRVTFRTSWDRDNRTLTYELLRAGSVVASTTADSAWYSRPNAQLVDAGAPNGTYNYQVRARDAFGNTATGPARSVTITGGTNPPPNGPLATDAFDRTVVSGWGAAPTGGSWTISASSSNSSSVSGGAGVLTVAPSKRSTALLPAISSTGTDLVHDLTVAGAPGGTGAYLGTVVRSTAAGDYRARVRWQENGVVDVGLFRFTDGTETQLGSIAGVGTYAPGTVLKVRVQAEGTSPTTLRAKVWPAASAEPAAWTLTTTDATAGFQVAGSVGVSPYLSGGAAGAVTVRYDNVSAVRTP